MSTRALAFLCALAMLTAAADADQIIFKNGDKLTCKIESLDSGKLKVKTDEAGEISVDLTTVQSFTTDQPMEIRTNDNKYIDLKTAQGDGTQIKGPDGQVIPFTNINAINPPASKWTGAIVVNGTMQRGNTFSDTIGVNIAAELRRQTPLVDDRTTLGAQYNFGRQKDPGTGIKSTTTDNWTAGAKYDKFFNPKFYGYAGVKAEHDRIAELNYRIAPGVGVGYQWVERPDFSFNTEAGVSYIHEDFTTGDTNDSVALRLAYHLTKKLNDKVGVFHNLEWLPAFDDPSDYLLTTDVGIRADMTQTFFLEAKAQFKRDSTPAPGALKNDMLYSLGVGWRF